MEKLKFRKKFTHRIMQAFLVCMTLVLAFGAIPVSAEGVRTQLIKSVEPKTSVSVLAGELVTLRALADKEATVVAAMGGKGFNLKRSTKKQGSYYWFEGTTTIPSGKEGTSVGEITFTATKDGISESKAVPGYIIAKVENVELPPSGDGGSGGSGGSSSGSGSNVDGNVTPQSGQQVAVVSKYADVFIPTGSDRGEDYAAPYYYNLPKNTIDYLDKVDGNMAQLRSGRRVKMSDISTYASSGTQGNNAVSGVTVTADNQFTYVDIKQNWNVPFNVEAQPFSYSGGGNAISSYSPSKIVITFDYTTSIDPGNVDLPGGSQFSAAKWSTKTKNGIAQAVLELTMRENTYYGCYAEYGSKGNLTLRFYNPIHSLDQARIVIDPGHGENGGNMDSGAVKMNTYEYQLNYAKACAIRDELKNRGATVMMLDSKNEDYKDLNKRSRVAVDWEPHLFISVHHNSTGAAEISGRGIEVYYNTPFSFNLAKNVCNNIFWLYQELPYGNGALNRGHKFSEFAVTRQKQYASILVEYGFLNNKNENAVVKDPNNLPLFASATANGIEDYLLGK